MKTKTQYRRRKQQRRKAEIDIYKDRVALSESEPPFRDVTSCPYCLEELVFAMQDNTHQFSMGLSTILRCLAIAEQEGYVPKLPYDWWNSLRAP